MQEEMINCRKYAAKMIKSAGKEQTEADTAAGATGGTH